MSTINYTLCLEGVDILSEVTKNGVTSFQQLSAVKVTNGKQAHVQYSKKEMWMSLYGTSFVRKMYEPGNIQAEIMIKSGSDYAFGVSTLTDLLVGKSVRLDVTVTPDSGSGTTYQVCSGYYVHEISPQFEKDSNYNYVYVKLDIFSPDKTMTLNKFSRVYPAKTFVSGIVKPFAGSSLINVPLRAAGLSLMPELTYTVVDQNNQETQHEFIHPYLVQYNESFYDFIRRVANRCGEAFYFENGQLCFGLSPGATTNTIGTASRVIFQHISSAPLSIRDYARDSVKGVDYDLSKGKYTYTLGSKAIHKDPVDVDENGFPRDAFPLDGSENVEYADVYNSEIASEDQYIILFKDKFARDGYWNLWWGDSATHAMKIVSDVLNSTSLLEILSKLASKEIVAAIKAGKKKGEDNDKGNKILKKAAGKGDSDATPDDAVMVSGVANDSKQWLTVKKYQDIRRKEEEVMRKTVCVDMGTAFRNTTLGEKIKVPGGGDQVYVVVRIDMSSGTSWQRSYEGLSDQTVIRGNPLYQRIYAVPLDGGVFYPPLLPDKPFRESGPQPAFIVDSGDPIGQGRVRVRFAWQPLYGTQGYLDEVASILESLKQYGSFGTDGKFTQLTTLTDGQKTTCTSLLKSLETARTNCENSRKAVMSEASPWIRMTSPFASPGAGMYFSPKVGDEVMVDFENGNVERPYVVGALYSKNVPVPPDGSMVIKSRNGHVIKMTDPTDLSDFIAGLYPGIKYLNSLGVKTEMMKLEGDSKKILGGIELSDQYGFYNIKMSTHDRNISISSPFGDVKINALTGISIDAPNGDISIRGKNINLTAFNKVRIESGKNVKLGMAGWVKNMEDPKEWGKTISKTLLNTFGGKFFDLSLIRSLVEIFIRPIDGTLAIKSGRFMQLEAGKGRTSADGAFYNKQFFDSIKLSNEGVILRDFIQWIKDRLELYVKYYIEFFNEIVTSFAPFAADSYYGTDAEAHIRVPDNKQDFLRLLFRETANATDRNIDNTINRLLRDTTKLTVVTSLPVGPERTQFVLDTRDKLVKLMRAIHKVKSHIGKIDTWFNAPPDKVGQLSHVKSFMDKYNGFRADAVTIMKLDNPNVPNAPDDPDHPIPIVAPNPIPSPRPKTALPDLDSEGLYGEHIQDFLDFQNSGTMQFIEALDKNAFKDWKKYVFRRLTCLAIEMCRSNNHFKQFSVAPAVYLPTVVPSTLTLVSSCPASFSHPFSDEDWPKYVKEIALKDIYDPGKGEKFLSGLKEGAMDVIGKFQFWPESSVWKADAKGEILFSDDKNKTYQFKNGSVESHESLSREQAADEGAIKAAMNSMNPTN